MMRLRMLACLPACWRTPVASYMTTAASTKARANESDVVPFFTPSPVTRPITKAEWEEGIPPDPSRRHTSQRRSE